MLFPDRPTRRDDFYLSSAQSARGRAVVWALEQGGELACTVGAYAIGTEQALHGLRRDCGAIAGRASAGGFIVRLANTLSAQGLQPLFLCSPERVHFYTRLGFEKLGEYARYEATV